MVIGDIVENGYAGDNNPNKKTMFIRTDGNFNICMTRSGGFCHFLKDDCKMKIIGHIEINF